MTHSSEGASPNSTADFRDGRPYRLQAAAHVAVARAVAKGTLTRLPCESCGAAAQAHHDSYHPDRRLDVRWLCPAHHSEWHRRNEPEWPAGFGHFAARDELGRRITGKAGRPPAPWMWHARAAWYVTLGGRRYNLGPDRVAAFERFEVLLADGSDDENSATGRDDIGRRHKTR